MRANDPIALSCKCEQDLMKEGFEGPARGEEPPRHQWNQAIDHDSGLTKMSATLACVSPANFKAIDPEQVLLHEQCYSERWDLFLNCRVRMCHHVRALSLLFVCSL